jgi:hypothetical protein
MNNVTAMFCFILFLIHGKASVYASFRKRGQKLGRDLNFGGGGVSELW